MLDEIERMIERLSGDIEWVKLKSGGVRGKYSTSELDREAADLLRRIRIDMLAKDTTHD